MNSIIKDKWLQALRSGKYKQGQQTLRRGNEFCCLGVLCNIINSKNWKESPYFNSDNKYEYIYEYIDDDNDSSSTGVLTNQIRKIAELQNTNPTIKIEGKPEIYSLGTLNDRGISFEELADLIEQQL